MKHDDLLILFWSKSISWMVSRHRAGSEDFPSRGSRCTDCFCSFCSFRSGLGSEQRSASCYSLHKTATTENGKITNPGKHCLDFPQSASPLWTPSFCWAFSSRSFFFLPLPFGVATLHHLFASPFLLSGSSIIIILSPVSPLSLLSTCPNHLNLASLILSPNVRCPADFLISNPVYPCRSKRKSQHPLLWTVDELKKSTLYTSILYCVNFDFHFVYLNTQRHTHQFLPVWTKHLPAVPGVHLQVGLGAQAVFGFGPWDPWYLSVEESLCCRRVADVRLRRVCVLAQLWALFWALHCESEQMGHIKGCQVELQERSLTLGLERSVTEKETLQRQW